MLGKKLNYVPNVGAKAFLVEFGTQSLNYKDLEEQYQPKLDLEGGLFFKEDFLLGSLQDESYFLKFNSDTTPIYRLDSEFKNSNSIWTMANKMTFKECRRFTPNILNTKLVQFEDLEFEDWCKINPKGSLGMCDLWYDKTFKTNHRDNPYVWYVTCEEIKGK